MGLRLRGEQLKSIHASEIMLGDGRFGSLFRLRGVELWSGGPELVPNVPGCQIQHSVCLVQGCVLKAVSHLPPMALQPLAPEHHSRISIGRPAQHAQRMRSGLSTLVSETDLNCKCMTLDDVGVRLGIHTINDASCTLNWGDNLTACLFVECENLTLILIKLQTVLGCLCLSACM